jgi:predicted ATPase/DNA-binding winged helix-turn-helix (wHTH) protein
MSGNRQITFGPYRLDESNECLWRDARPLALRPKAFALLKFLLDHPGHLVTKQQLLDAVWPGTFVTDAVLKDSIRQLREVLEDDAKSPQFIETVHRRGYRFIGQIAPRVTPDKTEEGAPASPPVPLNADPPAALFAATPSLPSVFGRQSALTEIQGWLGRALRADKQLVFVTGEAGIGKTTLVETFLDQAAAHHGLLIARGQCLEQYGAGEPYLPVLEAFSRLCREPGDGQIIALLRRYAPTWLIQMPSLITAAEREDLQRQISGATRDRMLREMAEAIEALTAKAPLVLILEDLHWSDHSTLNLISYLARRREPARLMVIATYRPVEVILSEHPLKGVKQELQAHRLCKELPLEYLGETAIAEFIAVKFPCNQLPAGLARLIQQRTEGNPLFMVNLVDYLLAERIIREEQGQWRLQVDLAELEPGVPENIRHLIEKQIERLGLEQQRVLEAASVVGMECSAVAIAAALNEDILPVEEQCEELARRQQFLSPSWLVELPDGRVTPRHKFMHILYLDVIYSRIAVTRRGQMHLRVGNCGEAVYGAQVSEIAAELAVHFEQGRDWPRAVKYLHMAAENAASSFASHEAATLLKRARELTRLLPDAEQRHDARPSSA